MTDVSEAYFSRDGGLGEQNSFDLVYFTFNEVDENTAATDCIAAAPTTYLGMELKQVSRKQINNSTYQFTLNYKVDEKQTQTSDPPSSEFNTTLAFNVVGGTRHVTNSETYTIYTKPGNDEIDFEGAIGVTLTGSGANKKPQVRGVDAFSPTLDYSYSTQFANAIVDNDYVDDLFNMTGKTNDATFYGRPAGSVLFKGARGSKKGRDRWEISFEFAYAPNQTGLVIGAIKPIDLKGWEYLDILYAAGSDTIEVEGEDYPLMKPLQATVHEIYPPGDFSLLKIGDGS